jgi:hypothetical protein
VRPIAIATQDLTKCRHIAWAALQSKCFEQAPHGIAAALIALKLEGSSLTSLRKLNFELFKFNDQARCPPCNGLLGFTAIVGTTKIVDM